MSILSLALAVLLTTPMRPPATPQPAVKAQEKAPPTPPAVSPTGEPNAPARRFDEGPLKSDVIGAMEVRRWAEDAEMAKRMQTGLQMQIRIQGEKITRLARYGSLIFTDLKDDTGEVLIDETTYTPMDKSVLRPSPFPTDRIKETGLPIMVRVKPSARAAKTLSGHGTIRLVFTVPSGASEKITIENPAQYQGRRIEHPRLEELGIVIELVPPEQVKNMPPGERGLALDRKAKDELIQNITFYDGWMRPMVARDIWAERIDDNTRALQFYRFDSAFVNDEMQMVIEVRSEVEDIQLPVDLKAFPLP
jgi:hypothetical protein